VFVNDGSFGRKADGLPLLPLGPEIGSGSLCPDRIHL